MSATRKLIVLGLLALCLLFCWDRQQKRPVQRIVWRAVQVWFWLRQEEPIEHQLPPHTPVYQARADGVLQHSQGW